MFCLLHTAPALAQLQPEMVETKEFKPFSTYLLEKPLPAPAINVTVGGRNTSLYEDKVVMLYFWHTRCTYCYKNIFELNALKQKLIERKLNDIEIIIVSLGEDIEGLNTTFYQDNNILLRSFNDFSRTIADRFAVASVPSAYVVDKEKNITLAVVGEYDWLAKDVDVYLSTLANKTN